jgi:hypothetical protein
MIMQALRKLGLLRSAKLANLPIEIWEDILDHAIHVPFVFDSGCQARDFHRFIASRETDNWKDIEQYWAAEVERVKLRLVCRVWKEILDRLSLRWIHRKSQAKAIRSGTKRIDITTLEHVESLPDEIKSYASLLPSCQFETNLSVVYIKDLSNDASVLFENAKKIPHVRSINYSCDNGIRILDIPPSFVSSLQESFAQLTCLTIWGGTVEGPLVLPNLEVLSINVIKFPVEQWWFPSLKHYHIGMRYRIVQNFSTSWVPGPTTRLLSLYLFGFDKAIKADEQFWEDFPSLQFLGTPLAYLDLDIDLPSAHPLSTFFLCECITDSYGSSINYGKLATVTDQIPNLTTLVVPAECFIYEAEAAIPLSKDHAERGIEWVDMHGGELLEHKSAINSNVGFYLAALVAASLVAQHLIV